MISTLLRTGATLFALTALAAAQGPSFFSSAATGAAAPAGVIAAPVLDDNATSAASAESVLGSVPPPLAVQIRMELTDPAALGVFNDFALDYVLTEFNTGTSDLRTKTIADAILDSTQSGAAFVGNFNLYPNLAIDSTRPAAVAANFHPSYAAARGHLGQALGKQIAAPALFPGSPDFRNPANGNSTAPNIRSALFTLPIQRLTYAELGVRGLSAVPTGAAAHAVLAVPNDAAQRLIPWIARFNNYGNPALGGGPSGSGFVQNAATPSNGQLLSRGDYQALILHCLLRGADSVAVLGSQSAGQVGYSPSQELSDVQTGWTASPDATEIISRGDYAFVDLGNLIGDTSADSADTAARDTEVAGAVMSGVYDQSGTSPSDGFRHMTILISNMSPVTKQFDMPNDIGGFSVFHVPGATESDADNFTLANGTHRLLNFSLKMSANNIVQWVLTTGTFIGLDNNRNGVGVGDPFPAIVIPIATDSEVCVSSAANTAMVDDLGAGATYHWFVQNGTIVGGQGTNIISYSAADTGAVVITLTASFQGNQYQGDATVPVGPPGGITTPPFAVAFSQNLAAGPDGNNLTYQWNLSGSGNIVGSNQNQGVQFSVGASGSVTLTLTTSDGNCSRTSTATVTIDQAPVVTNDRAFTTGTNPVDIQVLANDSDPDAGDTLTLAIASQPQFGSVMLINNGTAIRYTPTGMVKNDSFTYTVTDSHGAVTTGTVTIGDRYVAGIGDFHGLALPSLNTPNENARHGFVRVTVAKAGKFTGYAILAGVRRAISGTFDANGVAQFPRPAGPTFSFVRRAGETPVVLSLQLAPGGDPDQVSGLLTLSGAAFADLAAVRIVPAAVANVYTHAFIFRDAPNRTVPATDYPQANGYGLGALNAKGGVTLRGRLADFAAVVQADVLTKGPRVPFYVPLYGGLGSLSGWINYRNLIGTDTDASDLSWFRPAMPASATYPKGWPGGIGVDLAGSIFKAQGKTSALPGLGPVDTDGNAQLVLSAGGLPAAGFNEALNISPANKVTKVLPNPRALHGLLLTAGGGFNASFRAPGAKADYLIRGVVLQKGSVFTGFFLTPTVTGSAIMFPTDHPVQSP